MSVRHIIDNEASTVAGYLKQNLSGAEAFSGAIAFRRWKLDGLLYSCKHSVLLQWGHRLSAMETGQPVVCVAPVRVLQWGHRLSAMETAYHRLQTQQEGASFNGATAFQRWKPARTIDAGVTWFNLQWGHRLSAMETDQHG